MHAADFVQEIPLATHNGVAPFNTKLLFDDASEAHGHGKIL
jgi:hypothetical protein